MADDSQQVANPTHSHTEVISANDHITQTTTTTTIIQSSSAISTLAASNDEESYGQPSLQININRVGEELIYDNSCKEHVGVPKLDITLLSSTETSTVAAPAVDLNSTVLDCEEILSNYSTTNIGSPRNIDIDSPAQPVNEVANAVEAMSDVTMSLINTTATTTDPSAEESKVTPASENAAKENDNKSTRLE